MSIASSLLLGDEVLNDGTCLNSFLAATCICQPATPTTPPRRGVLAAIGNTPLIKLEHLSAFTGCTILAKCEHLNPGGSVKDRAALYMIEQGERAGELQPGSTIYEGTGGNTGVGLAMVAAAKGYGAVLAMPASIAQEKIDAMQTFGAQVLLTPSVPFTSPEHYFHRAREGAAADPKGYWCNQFDNMENYNSHYTGTAPELWAQSQQKVTGFVVACGTGGTLAGITGYLKEQDRNIQCYLADPHGSALFDYVSHRDDDGTKDEEGGSRCKQEHVGGETVTFIPRDTGNSVTEGIGIGRVTKNFAASYADIDGAFKIHDKDAIEMAYFLKEKEGVYVGPSAALNVVAAVKLAQKMGKGNTIVTVLCDGGARYKSKLYTKSWLEAKGFVLMGSKERNRLQWLGRDE